ncbi:MAG: hypothetical protein V4622_03695 [Bacteroidota bacterium]
MTFKLFILTFLILSSNPCEEISLWKNLLEHKVPTNLEERLKLLNEKGFDLQNLSDKGGKIINLDYFPVVVKVLPKNPKTGQQFTAEEFLNHLRLNSNHFVNKKHASFSTSPLLGKENKELWFSDNPLGAVIHINIPFPAGDGSVVCTENTSDHWIYQTIRTPWRFFGQGNDGKHPVTGLRQMGFIKNEDGSYTFYTKGIDRMSRKSQAIVAENLMRNPFKSADECWESFRQGIYDFVEQNGGNAVSLDSTKVEIYRPKWKKVKDCK